MLFFVLWLIFGVDHDENVHKKVYFVPFTLGYGSCNDVNGLEKCFKRIRETFYAHASGSVSDSF